MDPKTLCIPMFYTMDPKTLYIPMFSHQYFALITITGDSSKYENIVSKNGETYRFLCVPEVLFNMPPRNMLPRKTPERPVTAVAHHRIVCTQSIGGAPLH